MSIIDMTELIAERTKRVLGFAPPIERPEPTRGEQVASLDYRNDKLRNSGFSLTARFAEEIDACLALCLEAFESSGTL